MTPKREAFCLAFMDSKNQSEAYRRAFDAENMSAETIHKRASELMANGEVRGRIAELQAIAVERALVSVQSLTQELEEARALAHQLGQPSAAVSASMGKAKLHGLLTDKTELTGKDGGAIQLEQVKSDAELFTRSIAGVAARIGEAGTA